MRLLPLAGTVGFSGPCRWFSDKEFPDPKAAADAATAFQEAAPKWLGARLTEMPKELGLQEHHFLSGISQIAVGGDHTFTEACQELGIPQRISLPQPSDVFLDAIGFLGVILPVVAVAALSLAAAKDLEARSHTFQEMRHFLIRQAKLLKNATSGSWLFKSFHLSEKAAHDFVQEVAEWFVLDAKELVES